jgi:glycosyltransferase involved in cell wall biosynthesis
MMASDPPRRILMTLDAVGGVWRYAMDLASGLRQRGTEVVFACFGPAPSASQRAEAAAAGELLHVEAPLDWLAAGAAELEAVPGYVAALARRRNVDLIHLNLPSQAAGLRSDRPVVVVSHSCVVTWFHTVRHSAVPEGWHWQHRLNQAGFGRADAVVAPSGSHAGLLAACYRGVEAQVVHNAVRSISPGAARQPFVIAAGRWWDEGKNARTLDAAAAHSLWPVYMAGSQHGPNGQHQPIRHARALGELGHRELCELMAEASVFVSPSLYEPFGLAPLEAASSGLPLLLADIPTYRELWDGAALFARPHDPHDFARGLNELSMRADLRADLGNRARRRSRRFSLRRQVTEMTSLYAGVLAGRNSAPQRASA